MNTEDAVIAAKWKHAQELARNTATWAKTMTKVIISQNNKGGSSWHVINFLGPGKAESRGIVDLLAIRKSHKPHNLPLKRGDLFEMILIQVKGRTARRPSAEERERLRVVAATYHAKTILLSEWKKGSRACFFRLDGDEWSKEINPGLVFGQVASLTANVPSISIDRSNAAKKAWVTRRARAKSAA